MILLISPHYLFTSPEENSLVYLSLQAVPYLWLPLSLHSISPLEMAVQIDACVQCPGVGLCSGIVGLLLCLFVTIGVFSHSQWIKVIFRELYALGLASLF